MEFTAVYNTESMKGVEYSFKADSVKKAEDFCRYKFSEKDIVLISHDGPIYPDWPIYLGDKIKTSYIHRAYIRKHQGTMKSKRTIAIFFEQFTKRAQKSIIAEELGRVTGDEGVSRITVTMDEDLYGYNQNPDNQTLEQHLHVKARHNGHDHKWLMVWDCMEAEFTNLMEDNQ